MPIELEQLHRKRVELEDELYSNVKKERTLQENLEILEEKLAIRELEEKLRARMFPILCGEEAIGALRDFIDEIKEQKGKELIEKQVDALTELANGLIISIKTQKSPLYKPTEWYATPEKVRRLYLS